MNLTTLTRVKTLLDLAVLDLKRDAIINQLIANLSAEAERYMNRWAEQKQRTEQYDVQPGTQRFWLHGFPVVDPGTVGVVTEFRNNGLRDFSGSAIDANLYFLNLRRGVIQLDRF